MSKLVKVAAGVGLVALGALSGGVLFLPGTALAFTIGSSALIATGLSIIASTLLGPKGVGREERQASETSLQLGEVPRQAGFGRFATAGSLNDAFNFGGKYGTDWEVLSIALVDHECESLEGFYVNDDYVAFAGDGPVAGYNGQLEVYFRDGSAGQTLPAILTTNGPGWTASDVGTGITHVTVAYKADDPEAENPVWTAGRPRFLWVLKGKKCYISAKDGTVAGGSGTHRIDDPATWEWTDNPIDCRYNFQRGIYAGDDMTAPDQLLIGRGLSAIEAPPENAIAHAALCDEQVALKAGGSEKRYTFDGMIGADEDFLTVEGHFADSTAGIIRQPDGGIEVEPGGPKAVVAEITDHDILNLAEVELELFRGEADREWLNTVVPRYVAPEQKWSMHGAPIRRVYADVIEDGGPRSETLELKHVSRGTQAQRVGEIRRKLGRLLATGSLSLGPRFVELEEGDWIGWTSDRHFGGARRVFRIESYARDAKWHVRIQLREIAAAAYGFTAASDEEDDQAVANQQAAPGAIEAPGSAAWSVTAGKIDGLRGVQPALVIGGARDNDRANAIRLEVRKVGETDWRLAGDYSSKATDITIPGVADGTGHEVAVSYVVDGEVGARRVLPPVTTGDVAPAAYASVMISTSYVTDADPADGLVQATDTSISIESHTRTYADFEVAVTGGTLNTLDDGSTAIPADTLCHIYYDDEDRLGGAVALKATTSSQTAVLKQSTPFRHYVASIRTDVIGGSGTSSGGSAPPGWDPSDYNEP